MFEKLHSFEKAGMEILSICIKATKSTWLELYNVYLPNTSTHHTSFDPSLIKPGPSSLILGDLNGHSQIGTPFSLKTSVTTKFLTGHLTMIFIFLTMALLFELAESLETIALPSSPSVGAIGQRKHPGD